MIGAEPYCRTGGGLTTFELGIASIVGR
jgi:hypothetical protein